MIYAPIIDFDWAVFVEDNQDNRSLLGETKFEATMKKKKQDIQPNFRYGLPSGHLACVAVVSVSFKPSGASARGHWAKRSKKSRSGGEGRGRKGNLSFPSPPLPPPPAPAVFAPFCPMPSCACPAWLEGNGNDCYAGYRASRVRSHRAQF